jgi:hypothetical protein
MATLEELGAFPPITVDLDLFDYAPLDSRREPPPVELHARLARHYKAGEAEDQGLRLAFVAGHPVESPDLLVLAYLWRAAGADAVWGVERWPSPERRLRLYRHDPAFEPRSASDVHAEVRRVGSMEGYARDLLGS